MDSKYDDTEYSKEASNEISNITKTTSTPTPKAQTITQNISPQPIVAQPIPTSPVNHPKPIQSLKPDSVELL